MKITIYSFALILFFLGSNEFTYAQTDSTAVFDVAGNCGMCKKRIENAATIDGVETAVWDMKTHRLTVKYNRKKTSLAAIQQSIAHVGHDTPLFRAPDEAYENLHERCRYERLGKDKDLGEPQHNTTPGEGPGHESHDHTITGGVVNESGKGDLTPIVGVNVVWLEEPTRRETSNENGVFKIQHAKGNKHLVFSFAGMQSDTIEVKDLHEVLVVHAQNNVLSEVVVSRKKKSTYIDALTPTRVEVLTARELFKAACCDLSESFETNVSVDVVSNDAVTGSKQIQMLGLSGIYTQLTVENLPGPRGFATPLGLNSIAG